MGTNSNKKIAMETEYVENKMPARLIAVDEVARFLGFIPALSDGGIRRGLLKSYPIGLRNNLRIKQEDGLNSLEKCLKGGELVGKSAR